jgi:hypothetical protein
MSLNRHINCVLHTSHVYIFFVTDTPIVSYRHYTPTYVLSRTHQLCLTDITCLHMICHRHISCVLQISHAYLCLVIDISIMSYRHYMPTYVLSQTLQLCLTDITRLHISYHRYINCVWQISHAYIWLVTDISIVSYRHHTLTYVSLQTHQLCLTHITCLHVLSQTHQLCLREITRLHMT